MSYGARAINEGGWQAIPELAFPGGALIGCSAGFVNVPRIKGTHTAMKSAMLAAEAAFEAHDERSCQTTSWKPIRRPCVRAGSTRSFDWSAMPSPRLRILAGTLGTLYAGLDMWLGALGLRLPWTLKHKADNTTLRRKDQVRKIDYPKPDGVLTFDRLTSVFLSNTNHEEDQPVHLTLKDAGVPVDVNLPLYDGPEQRYCPAGVYEFVEDADGRAAAADQCPELRSLQNLRHQGSDPEHQLGHS